jgi:hypothetical protein
VDTPPHADWRQLLANALTENDGVSFCAARLLAAGMAIVGTIKFYQMATPDFTAFGVFATGILAAIAYNKSKEQRRSD